MSVKPEEAHLPVQVITPERGWMLSYVSGEGWLAPLLSAQPRSSRGKPTLPVAPLPASTSSLLDTLSAVDPPCKVGVGLPGSMAGGLIRLRLSQLVGSSTLTVPPG
jgi:hypothetical protein